MTTRAFLPNRARGEDHPHAVFTRQQVATIRWLWEHNADHQWSQLKLARHYGVSRGAITGVVYYYNWEDVEPEAPDSEGVA